MRCSCKWLSVVGVSLVVVVAGVSCTSQRLGYDHRQMRTELLTAYEEQLMDNLIRAREGLPLLQIRYGVIDGTSKTNIGGSLTVEENSTDVIKFGNDSITDNDGTNGTVKGDIESTMAIKGTPVLDDAGVYKAYREFAGSYLRRSHAAPSEEYILYETRKRRDATGSRSMHYWVPRTITLKEKDANGKNKVLDVAGEMEILLDRVMLDQKKDSGGGADGTATVLVLSIGQEKFVGSSREVLALGVGIAPNPRMVHGQLKLSTKTNDEFSRADYHAANAGKRGVVEAAGMLVPAGSERCICGAEKRREGCTDACAKARAKRGFWLYFARGEIQKVADAENTKRRMEARKKGEAEPAPYSVEETARRMLEGKVHSISFVKPENQPVDLNRTVSALADFLEKAGG